MNRHHPDLPAPSRKPNAVRFGIDSLAQLRTLAIKISQQLPDAGSSPFWIHLRGDLGAGKTTFAQFFIQALGYRERVKSPTYSLMEYYPAGDHSVLHMDLYRLADPEELEFIGLDDLLSDNPVVLVEWPEKGRGFLPPANLELRFTLSGDNRTLEIYDPHQVFSLS